MRRWFTLVTAVFLVARCGAGPTDRRWVYVSTNLAVSENVARVETVLRRARAAGFNGVLLNDYKLGFLEDVPAAYVDNARHVMAAAHELGMDVVPAVCPIGYSNSLLYHNPNLAEGLPVREAPYLVRGMSADILPDPASALPDPGFERSDGDRFTGWAWQDTPVKADRTEKHGGLQSARMDGIGAAEAGNSRIMQTLTVHPFRQYHLSVWVKTRDLDSPGSASVTVLGETGRQLVYPGWAIARTQDWTQYHVTFNSQKNRKVNVYLGVWGGRGGTIWWDDAVVEEVGFLNVLRRDGCPVEVRAEDGTVYTEGKDYEPVVDPRMGTVPWKGSYEVYHPAPPLRLLPGSRIKDGQTVLVSFDHAAIISGDQVTCCLTDPEVYRLLRDQFRRVNDLFHPKGLFLSYDEIRVANWCDTCRAARKSPGGLLAASVARTASIARAINPKIVLYTWSDMFDPNHNAHDNYYLVNGSWADSWKGLPKDVIVANWNSGKRCESMAFFQGLGNRQILAGYYDADPAAIRGWLDDAKPVPGVCGVMYTTWQDRYDDLEAFAAAAWGS